MDIGRDKSMSEIDFAEALERELRGRGISIERGELFEFVEDVWKQVGARPDVRRWAGALLDEGAAMPDGVASGRP
jgi:hypothetical protein